jgi:2-methylisocitrate lyase-like PEP mutase family enzyme
LAFFSGAAFLPAYVFFGAASVFFAVIVLTAGFAGLEVAAGFLAVLAEDALVVEVFEDGALRPVEDLVVVVDLPVEVFDFDPGFVTGFEAALVVGGFEVFEVGLF